MCRVLTVPAATCMARKWTGRRQDSEMQALQKRREESDLVLGWYVKELNCEVVCKGSKAIGTLEIKETKMEIIHSTTEESESKVNRWSRRIDDKKENNFLNLLHLLIQRTYKFINILPMQNRKHWENMAKIITTDLKQVNTYKLLSIWESHTALKKN